MSRIHAGEIMVLYILLNVFLIAGLIVGWINGQQKLNSSQIIYRDQSMFEYWIGNK